MKKTLMFCCVGLTLCCQGCLTFRATARTMVVQPAHYCEQWDRLKTYCQHRHLALEALATHTALCGVKPSHDFTKGFIAGYTHYLDKGGNGNPPPVPPRDYWRVKYRTPEGRPAVEDWFAGYRAGADAAIASGFRHVTTIATSVPPPPPRGWSTGTATEEAPAPSPRPDEILPLPSQQKLAP